MSKILKRVINESRPTGARTKDPGMPSSHSMRSTDTPYRDIVMFSFTSVASREHQLVFLGHVRRNFLSRVDPKDVAVFKVAPSEARSCCTPVLCLICQVKMSKMSAFSPPE
jgi:hypothetical protein